MRVLRAAARVAVPWKGGAGTTLEVARFPEGATPRRFGWRISLVEAARTAAFPNMPGVECRQVRLAGRLSLLVEGREGQVISEIARYRDRVHRSLQVAEDQSVTVVALRPLKVKVAASNFALRARDAVLVGSSDGGTLELHPGAASNDYFVIRIDAA